METITYNKPEDSQRRSEAKEMTFQEEKEASELINKALTNYLINSLNLGKDNLEEFSKEKERIRDLVQKFVDNYQNLNHHKAITVGMYGTDHPKTIERIKASEEGQNFWSITY